MTLFALTNVANAAIVPGVSLVVAPASLSQNIGDTFRASVVVKTPGSPVYAVEGTVVFDGLSCQSIILTEGLIAQTTPTCANPYFLVGVPSGTATDKGILSVSVKALREGNATLGISAVDIIGEGVSLSTTATGAVYTIAKKVTPVYTSDDEPETTTEVIVSKPQVKVEEGVVSQAPKASSTAATQLAAVAQFVATNSTIFWILGLLAMLIGSRRFMNKYEIVNVPQTPQKSVPPEKKGK